MSGVYSLEPPTRGKVVLKTSLGPIEIELWAKEAPLAVRNFVQHSLEHYFDGTLFHRVVKGFVLQGGDPTGVGDGGESVYADGKPFAAEFHPRLRFSHRGVVAMAGADKDDNRSQFFITLDRCEELDGHHTIFGKVTGDTIFNVLEANTIELLPGTECPANPLRIDAIDVVWNPFDDIVPRVLPPRDITEKKKRADDEDDEVRRKTAKRDSKLLSFGDEEEEAASAGRVSLRPPVVSAAASEKKRKHAKDAVAKIQPTQTAATADDFDRRMREQLLKKHQRVEEETPPTSTSPVVPVSTTITPIEQKQRKKTVNAAEEEKILARIERIRKLAAEASSSSSWMSHRLVFEKQPHSADPMAREDGQYTSYDPRMHPPVADKGDTRPTN